VNAKTAVACTCFLLALLRLGLNVRKRRWRLIVDLVTRDVLRPHGHDKDAE
jgi:hypothetical protein